MWRGDPVASYHDLYVGGRCTTNWVTRFTVDTLDNGKVVGSGTARLLGRRVCTFPNAQIQAERIEVSVEGDWSESGFSLRLNDGERTPKGTADYGGFAPTVFDEGPTAVMRVDHRRGGFGVGHDPDGAGRRPGPRPRTSPTRSRDADACSPRRPTTA